MTIDYQTPKHAKPRGPIRYILAAIGALYIFGTTFALGMSTVQKIAPNVQSTESVLLIETAIVMRLVDQPSTPTRAIKRLRPNPLAEFELRAGDLRALYNVEGSEVVLLVFGRKIGDKLIVKGEEFYGHQDNPVEPS